MKNPNTSREALRSRRLTLNDFPKATDAQRDSMLAVSDLVDVFDSYGTQLHQTDWTNLEHCHELGAFGVSSRVRGLSTTAKLIQFAAKYAELKCGRRAIRMDQEYSHEALVNLSDCIRMLAASVHGLQPEQRKYLSRSLEMGPQLLSMVEVRANGDYVLRGADVIGDEAAKAAVRALLQNRKP